VPLEMRGSNILGVYREVCEGDEVPDTYYGGEAGFHNVIDILENTCYNLVRRCASIKALI